MGTYFKRHILAVDDLTKINYEVIKNTPGSFQSIESPESDPILESEINLTKSKLFKNNLYSQNDAVLQSIANKLQLGDIVNNEEANEYHQIEKKIPIEKQISWLKQINQNLIKQYNSLLKEEKKWFILKELLLDANTEWDLYKSIDTAPNSKIRNDNMDNQKYTSISNTDNTATDKTSQSIPTKKDSKRLYYKLGLPELTSQQNTLVFNREQNIFFKKQKISEHGLKSIVSTSTPSSDSSPFVTASPLDSRTSDSQISDNKSED
ncbi:hypothetical protein TBLA_0D02550 [Henningerozyma blattae CBS 6284]|uniref:Uncharacterized protein n=1 Tax=Henningerozyma blattae (strain ATCC 34711 / CBS 6284 / DSM 70876 / NBRC 10599 / NRRL Y-10934 / UCD 77-7) TaxID=1071380 RepID=I2H306_HENB6|nr:hypothetical protein TBLA_0D02550 [Tetrapisispora blattae CBS 6284]CCH60758.1 hypothetical protein TBLA_0D02550 [Tetrapisispora blattae CBS 6284]